MRRGPGESKKGGMTAGGGGGGEGRGCGRCRRSDPQGGEGPVYPTRHCGFKGNGAGMREETKCGRERRARHTVPVVLRGCLLASSDGSMKSESRSQLLHDEQKTAPPRPAPALASGRPAANRRAGKAAGTTAGMRGILVAECATCSGRPSPRPAPWGRPTIGAEVRKSEAPGWRNPRPIGAHRALDRAESAPTRRWLRLPGFSESAEGPASHTTRPRRLEPETSAVYVPCGLRARPRRMATGPGPQGPRTWGCGWVLCCERATPPTGPRVALYGLSCAPFRIVRSMTEAAAPGGLPVPPHAGQGMVAPRPPPTGCAGAWSASPESRLEIPGGLGGRIAGEGQR